MQIDYVLPEMPRFDSPAAARRHMKQRLAAAFRLFSRFGFDYGVSGHITARDPEFPQRFWVNPLGQHFSTIRPGDLSLVDGEGKLLEGRPINAAAFAIHAPIHHARPDIVAAAHAHSPHGTAWSTFARPLDPLTQDGCAFYRDHAVYDGYYGVVLDTAEGARIAEVLGPRKAVIMRNHGLLTVGATVDEAAWWFIACERACQVQLLAEAAGKPRIIDDASAQATQQWVGTPYSGWYMFQNLWQRIVAEQPDLLDE